MAPNPPFPVEDNTDEDFFDKLVNDDDDMDFKASTSAASGGLDVLADGNESDEAKAFANLTVNELDDDGEVNLQSTTTSERTSDKDLNEKVETVEPITNVETADEHGNTLESADSFEFEHLIQNVGNENGGAEVSNDADSGMTMSEGVSDVPIASNSTSELGAPGVKQVAWSAFTADSVQKDSNAFGSYSDFFSQFEGDNAGVAFSNTVGVAPQTGPQGSTGNDVYGSAYVDNSDNYGQYNQEYNDVIAADQSSSVQDLSSTENWENQYPGWKYDHSTGQWYQVDGYNAGASEQVNANSNASSAWAGAAGQAELSYMQQTAHYASGAVAEAGTTESVYNWNQTSLASNATETNNLNQVSQVSCGSSVASSDWNQASSVNNGYPDHMVFDPQYPGWYYDTIAQEWRTLESYTASVQSTAQDQMNKDEHISTETFPQNNDGNCLHDQGNNYVSQGFVSQSQDQSWVGSANNYNQQNSRMWLPDTATSGEAALPYTENKVTENNYRQNVTASLHGGQQSNAHYGVKSAYYENLNQHQNDFSNPSQFVGGKLSQNFSDPKINQNDNKYFSNEYYNKQTPVNFSQQQIQNAQMAYNPASGRSSAGRPAHALVAFGFGGKLIVMKQNDSSENLNFGSQNPVGGSISVLNLSEVVSGNSDTSNRGMGVSNYFHALCRHSLPGPLAGGSVATKELNKWIEERLTNMESADIDYRKAEVLRLLLSLLKIACQYYGKLRSPYGTDSIMKESDAPESAVAKLFASAKRNALQFNQYGTVAQCMQQLPSEGQLQATAAEVQTLLVSGRKKEALQCAQEGQLWGPALVLAAQLGDQFYVETVKQMALCQLVAGSPLRTLCLLIAGQPADVFSADVAAVSNMAGAVNVPQQPQFGANYMLDDWEENLAVITANRTKDDELVLIHLGDCLWKERSDIIAAHICYLVAEASFELYSDSARLCLIGADHWKCPRTYASPEAIQRTEIYEYSKALGNSQFVLLPFQPYKYVYALMLAEVGRTSEALKYCQAVLKSLKTGRTQELENLRNLVSSLEERIKAHQQGGFSVNLAPKEFIGKLLNLFDSTAHRVVGGLPPPIPTAGGAVHGNENHYQSTGPRVSSSQSTIAMSSLVPQSVEPMNEWAADNKKIMHTRSVSEPDFGSRSPMQGQADPSKETSSAGSQDKASSAGVTSRLGRFSFGSQLFQKTVGLVLKPRQGKQAKLGETNKFYYDEKLKRWVEEGAAPPAPEAALPPPPTTMSAVFQNGASDKSSFHNEVSHNNGNLGPTSMDNSSGMPPLPPTTNQYSARGRMGVRSRYVDTFNRGGGNTASTFQSPSVPSAKPAAGGGANPKFFVPAPVSAAEQPVVDAHVEDHNKQNTATAYENPSSSPPTDLFHSPPPQSATAMPRFGSMSNIHNRAAVGDAYSRRRTASWSGSLNDSMSPPNRSQLGMQSASFMSPLSADSSVSGSGFGEDLHEVEL